MRQMKSKDDSIENLSRVCLLSHSDAINITAISSDISSSPVTLQISHYAAAHVLIK